MLLFHYFPLQAVNTYCSQLTNSISEMLLSFNKQSMLSKKYGYREVDFFLEWKKTYDTATVADTATSNKYQNMYL